VPAALRFEHVAGYTIEHQHPLLAVLGDLLRLADENTPGFLKISRI